MSAQSGGRQAYHDFQPSGGGSGSSTDMSAAEGKGLASDRAAVSAAAAVKAGAVAGVPLLAAGGTSAPENPQTQLHESAAEADADDSEEDSEEDETILARLRHMLHLDQGLRAARPPLLESFDLQGIAEYISSGNVRKIICMCGAGISVNAGIPDFRSPGTGLYDNLAKYDLPRPESVFELSYFRQNPKPFYMLSKELFPGAFKPTPTHSFIRLLHQKGLLQRCYTQNIDSLEREAGTPADLIVAAHGNFDAAHCIDCGHEVPISFVKAAVLSGEPYLCPRCNGLVKPDIVFFGEGLPPRFFKLAETDFADCDLLLVIGTSLVVQPFASLVGRVDDDTPRLLINKEKVSGGGGFMSLLSDMGGGGSLDFSSSNYRDALYLGDCDEGVQELCRLLGWQEELQQLVNNTSVIDWESEVELKQQQNASL